jgi:hypothetical protein
VSSSANVNPVEAIVLSRRISALACARLVGVVKVVPVRLASVRR